MKITQIDPKQLKPWKGNPKRHNIPAIRASMERFGFTDPILVQKGTQMVIAGHDRLDAAIESRLEAVPIIYVDLPDSEAKALSLAANQIQTAGGYDDQALLDAMIEVAQELPDLDLTALGFEGLPDMPGLAVLEPPALEPLDFTDLPARPKWILCAIDLDVYPSVKHLIEELKKKDGVTVEEADR